MLKVDIVLFKHWKRFGCSFTRRLSAWLVRQNMDQGFHAKLKTWACFVYQNFRSDKLFSWQANLSQIPTTYISELEQVTSLDIIFYLYRDSMVMWVTLVSRGHMMLKLKKRVKRWLALKRTAPLSRRWLYGMNIHSVYLLTLKVHFLLRRSIFSGTPCQAIVQYITKGP